MTDHADPPDKLTRRPRRVTAQDVATAAGVSRSAVSRAFTPGSYLNEAKRARVLETAFRIGYRPNALAASLQGKPTQLVAVIVGDLRNQYDAEFMAALVSALRRAQKWPLVLAGQDAGSEREILSVLRFPLDALIIRGGSVSPNVIQTCEKLSIPMIYTGRAVRGGKIDSIYCDNKTGMGMAVDLLIAKGRRVFGYLGGPADWSSETERLDGVVHHLANHGLSLVAHGNADYTFEGGAHLAAQMLRANDLDALICANDAMALGALSHARHALGLAVPDALSIIGFDDVAMAQWAEFRLTTLRNPVDETVGHILRLLDQRIDNPAKTGERVRIAPILMARDTH